jgi:hypothetical protein
MPRTTLSIDDEVFDLARRYARGRAIGLGQAVSDLVRKGLQKELGTRTVNGLVVFDLPADSPAVTPKDVSRLLQGCAVTW